MSPRCLVTGATGFIGSHLVDLLLERTWQVRCLTRNPEQARSLAALPVEIVPGNVLDADSLGNALNQVEYVFHVAGVTKAVRDSEYHAVNTRGTQQVLKACSRRADSLERVVLVSSLAACGPAVDGIPRSERSPCRPVSPYGESKLRAEILVGAWSERLACTIARPPVVYGPRDTDNLLLFRLIAMGLQPALQSPTRISIIHVRDLVEGLLLAATHPAAKGRTYFLTAEDAGLGDVLDLIAKCLGANPLLVRVPLEVLRIAAVLGEGLGLMLGRAVPLTRSKVAELRQAAWTCSGERAAHELGFEPRISLIDGIPSTIAWYRAARWL